jgi:uncharacterized protein (DUF2267 family)/iron-sulfur cluster repair protein YtfE (RIC family)
MIALTQTSKEKSWETWRDLMACIVTTYHDALNMAVPRLEGILDELARERRMPIHLLDRLLREFSALADSLRMHLSQQEECLFPMIRHACRSVEEAGWSYHFDDPVEDSMDEAAREGQEAVASLKRVEDCLEGANGPEKGALVGKLAKGLRELRQDLEEHTQLEAEILFPAVRDLLRGNLEAADRLLQGDDWSWKGPRKDHSVHAMAFDHWLDPVMGEMGYRDRQRASRVVRSVLHALRDRLGVDEAIAFGARLPKAVRGLYYEDWQHRWDPVRFAKDNDFLSQVAAAIKEEDATTDPERIARSILRVLAREMPAGEIEGVISALPGEIRSCWPAGEITPTEGLIIADQETG